MIKRNVKLFIIILNIIYIITLIGCDFEFALKDDFTELNVLNKIINALNDEVSIPDWTLETKIVSSNTGDKGLYKFIPNVTSLKYIAGYCNDVFDEYNFKYEKVKWVKYDSIDKIELQKEGIQINFLYAVIDGKLEYNYITNTNIDLNVKYFLEYSNFNNIDEIVLFEECAVWTDSVAILDKSKQFYEVDFYPIICTPTSDLASIYESINIEDNEYIKMKIGALELSKNRYIDYTITEFGQFYDQLNSVLIKEKNVVESHDKRFKYYYGMIKINEIAKLSSYYNN